MEVKIEKQKDGTYIAYNVGNPKFSLIGTGNTVSEAKGDFFNSLEEAKEFIPDSLLTTPEFHFDLSSLFEYYSMINVSAFARFIGINATLMRQYRKGDTYISEAQLSRIEDGIHRLGKEFTSLKLM